MAMNRKLRLDLQDLQVESFDSTVRPVGRGTVVGHNRTQQINCYTFYIGCDYSNFTCLMSCPATCDQTPAGCAPVPPTEEVTCLNATCYWAEGAAFYDGVC